MRLSWLYAQEESQDISRVATWSAPSSAPGSGEAT
jgi:hypothetical protein